MNNQSYKIAGQYYINLDRFVDISLLRDNYSEIALGVAKSVQHLVPIELGKQDAILDKQHIEPVAYMKNVFSKTKEYRGLVRAGLTRRQIYDYVLFNFDVMTLGEKLLLRSYKNYSAAFDSKHLSELNEDQPAYSNFPIIREWIEATDVFSQVGRIIIFVNNKGSYTPTHCDYQDMSTRKDQFVWINLRSRKKFFVLDEYMTKHYMDGEINTFDNAAWHGSDPAEYSCFSVRVDGVFSDTFLEKTKLKDHYEHDKNTEDKTSS